MKHQLSKKYMAVALSKRFRELSQRCLKPHSDIDTEPVYQALLARYCSPDRYYHDLNHLLHCLEQLDTARHLIPHPDAVEMALWYHDAVYRPGCSDNEQKSAELFLYDAAELFSGEFKNKIKALILATKHKDVPKDEDERFIVDIDLSSFGSEWLGFLTDTGNLRKEQANVPDPIYFQTHTRFLKYLLSRERIFYTDFFNRRFEQTALQNITRLLEKRTSEGYI